MKECTTCHCCFQDHILHCPYDGHQTIQSLAGDPTLDGRYQLERRLGQGGMGIVYKAHHVFLKTAHAIKVILPELVGNDPSLVTRFRQEAMAAAAIRHPNVVLVTDYGIIRGIMPFLVMEFIEGRSLHEVLAAAGKFPPSQALEFMTVIASGISAAHRHGIVHRDLKPLNIMLQDNKPLAEAIKILDFGLAKIKSGEWLGSFVVAQTIGMVGSPSYMAPELWSDEEPDQRSDIYSLGIILFQMLAGDVPFKGVSVPTIMKKHLLDPPPPFASLNMDVPLAIERVVHHALEKDPNKRPATTEEFIWELREAVTASEAWRHSPTIQGYAQERGEVTTQRLLLEQRQAEELRRFEEEQALRRAAEEEARRQAEEERQRLAAEEVRRQVEAETARQRAEEARLKAEEEEARRKAAEEERLRVEAEARRKAEEEAARIRAEEEALRAAEAEAQRKAEEEARQRAEEEARQRAEAEAARLRAAEEQRRREEEQRRAEEEAQRRAAEEARRRQEEEARQRAEEERLRAEEESRIKAEEEARRQAEEEAARLRVAEELRLKAEEEARRKAAEEARQLAAEEQRRREEAQRRAEEEAQRRAAEEARWRVEEEARRQAEEEAQRRAAEDARRQAAADAARDRQAQEERLATTIRLDEVTEQTISSQVIDEAQRYAEIKRKIAESESDAQSALGSLEQTRLGGVVNLPPPAASPTDAAQQTLLSPSQQTTIPLLGEQTIRVQPQLSSPGQTSVPSFDLPAQKKSFPPIYIAAALLLLLLGGGLYLLTQRTTDSKPPLNLQTPTTGEKEKSGGGATSTTTSPARDMVYIAGGTFQMGRSGGPDNEAPAHAVTVKPFSIDKTEVTNAQYAECVQASVCPVPSNEDFLRASGQPAPSDQKTAYWEPWIGDKPPAGQEQWPVRNVSAADAEAYARWLSKRDGKKYRLPTEEEWEYVARDGASAKLYPWGNQWVSGDANIESDLPKPVGSYKQGATSTGVLDLIGNVWEWTSSKASFYDKREIPQAEQGQAVKRGGSYKSKHDEITATHRDWLPETTRNPTIGFRLMRESP
jgi:formylglycine-generating enzyme required for sulfatase activity